MDNSISLTPAIDIVRRAYSRVYSPRSQLTPADWMAENTVMGRFSTVQASANVMEFDQVRIPLKDEATGRLVDARRWGRGLQRYLENLCGTDVKLEIRGLGHVILTIGGK